MKKANKMNMRAFTILALLTAILMVFSFTPLGTIPIGPLSITLNIIPIAIAAIALGPVGGLIIGAIFGLLSFLQCLSIGVPSGMGIVTFSISPFYTFIQRVVPRALDGLLVGLIYDALSKLYRKHNAKTLTLLFGSIIGIVLLSIGVFATLSGINKLRFDAPTGNKGTTFIVFGIISAVVGIGIGAIAFANHLKKEKANSKIMPECFIAGFLSAFLNTLFFMTALVLFFGKNPTVQEKYTGGKGIFDLIITTLLSNAIIEIVVSTIISGLVGSALYTAKVLPLKDVDLNSYILPCAGIIVAVAGISLLFYGINVNNSLAEQAESIINNGQTNPGTKFIVGGAIAAGVGAAATAVGIILGRIRSKKAKAN